MTLIRYILIDAAAKRETVVHLTSFEYALKEAGLTPGKVDHGTVMPGLSIVVDEHSLFAPPDRQHYFAIDRRLYAGNALLYGSDKAGKTCDIDLDHCRKWYCRWFDNADAVEAAIAAGEIDRPVGDTVITKTGT